MKRDEVVDISKGIGIMFVILGHLVFFNSVPFRFIFAFHMPLFYVLMGMIFPYELTLKKYLHKAKRILLSFLLYLAVCAAITFAFPPFRALFSFDEEARHKLFYEFQPECFHAGSLWFLFNAFVVITLYFLLSKLVFLPKCITPKTKQIILTVVILVLGVVGVLLFNRTQNAFRIPLTSEAPDLPLKLDTAICVLPFFYLGILLNKSHYKYKLYDLKLGYQLVGAVLAGAVVLVVSRRNQYVNVCNCFFGTPLHFYIASLSGVLMVVFVSSALSRIRFAKVFAFYGRDSLLSFALHTFPNQVYAIVLNKILGQSYGYLYMPLHWALIGVPAVLLMLAPIIAVKNKGLKCLTNWKKARENNGKQE